MSRRFTEAEIAEVWERGAGEPTRSIARRLGRNGIDDIDFRRIPGRQLRCRGASI